jgi:uncharacterized membrane protein YfcA
MMNIGGSKNDWDFIVIIFFIGLLASIIGAIYGVWWLYNHVKIY